MQKLKRIHSGFTLIELLVVIAVMAIIATAALVAINPIDKIRSGQDAKVQADLSQVTSAISAYETANNGTLPAWNNWAAITGGLVTAGELTAAPQDPDGAGALYTYNGSTAVGPPATAVIYSILLSHKYTGTAAPSKCINQTAYWFWNNSNGQACGECNVVPTAATACVWYP